MTATPCLDVDALLGDTGTSVIVCCGSGGVGKTTSAAALALRAAEKHGRRAVVLTIDPARRLAQSLGLEHLDNTPSQVEGVDGGSLDAMMLDMKRTFDEVVSAHTTPEQAAEIFGNPFYQAMSGTFAGTQEYMAMEKLAQLRDTEQWDLIVVDTPPSRSALDFLDAPARLARFLDGRTQRLCLDDVVDVVLHTHYQQDPRGADAVGYRDLRRLPGLDVRGFPHSCGGDLPFPAGPPDRLPGGRRS